MRKHNTVPLADRKEGMKVISTALPDVVMLEPRLFGDDRGFFFESYSEREFQQLGLPTRFLQDNHSRSVHGVLRGIHYQLEQPQGKLVRVLVGEVFDVAVDLRRSSPTYGKWAGEFLNASNHRMLWIPPGFGHAFLVTSDMAEFAYKASELYAPRNERTLLWNDPNVGIDWPLHLLSTQAPLLSVKDAAGSIFSQSETYA